MRERAFRLLKRFIPARAGNTVTAPWQCPRPSVHPRARGEHTAADYLAAYHGGSSPRARGTPRHRPRRCRAARFIPARAGNTTVLTQPPPRSSVHPRARGEHQPHRTHRRAGDGSSPRARGTPLRHRHAPARRRFIPARAGNTRERGPGRANPAVHPRARGEHPRRDLGNSGPIGSSPRARGTLLDQFAGVGAARFIPARARNTRSRSTTTWHPPVHPRARGEHRWDRGCFPTGTRFIPARAGNTK